MADRITYQHVSEADYQPEPMCSECFALSCDGCYTPTAEDEAELRRFLDLSPEG